MASILYITNGMSSTLNSSFELSRRLTAAGHRVSYASHVDLSETLASHGYSFHQLPPANDSRTRSDTRIRRLIANPRKLARWIRERRDAHRLSIEDDGIERTISRINPDLLVIDIEMHYAVIASAGLNIPTVLAIVWFSIFKRPGLPPLHTGLIPGGRMMRVAMQAAWWRLHIYRFLKGYIDRFSRRGLMRCLTPVSLATHNYHSLASVAKFRHFDIKEQTDRYQWLHPMVYKHVPIMCFNVLELEFPHDPHPNLSYVGPMVMAGRAEASLEGPSRRNWEQFKRRRLNEADESRKLIYCSLGTFWSADRDFLGRVIDTFRRRPDWNLVLGLGGKISSERFQPVPENVVLLDWAPQIEVLKIADCAITHGGITTINECLYFGVPLVVYSTGHVDQDGCAARVRYHRLGVLGNRSTDRSEHIESNIEKVLNDPIVHHNVRRIRSVFREYEQSGAAIKLIESLIEPSA